MKNTRTLLLSTTLSLLISQLGAGVVFAQGDSRLSADNSSVPSSASSPYKDVAIKTTFNFASDTQNVIIKASRSWGDPTKIDTPLEQASDGSYLSTYFGTRTYYGDIMDKSFYLFSISVQKTATPEPAPTGSASPEPSPSEPAKPVPAPSESSALNTETPAPTTPTSSPTDTSNAEPWDPTPSPAETVTSAPSAAPTSDPAEPTSSPSETTALTSDSQMDTPTGYLNLQVTATDDGKYKAELLTGFGSTNPIYTFTLDQKFAEDQIIELPEDVQQKLKTSLGVTLNRLTLNMAEVPLSESESFRGAQIQPVCLNLPAATAAMIDLKKSRGLSKVGDTFVIPAGQVLPSSFGWGAQTIQLPSEISAKKSGGENITLSNINVFNDPEISNAIVRARMAEGEKPEQSFLYTRVDNSKTTFGTFEQPQDISQFTGVVPLKDPSTNTGTQLKFMSSKMVGSLDFGCTQHPEAPVQGLGLLNASGYFTGDITEKTFTDVLPLQAFSFEMNWLANAGISTGWSDGTYRPLHQIDRNAMAAFFYRLAGSPEYTPPQVSYFKDVKPGDPFYKEVSWMADQKITTGWKDGTFRPYAPVNRDAMAAFFYRFAGSPTYVPSSASPFKDVIPEQAFYKEISWMNEKKIAVGWADGTYRPFEPVKRDAMAAFFYRFYVRVISAETSGTALRTPNR